MTLHDLGYNDALQKFRYEHKLDNFEIGRVITEHKERYIIKTEKGEFEAEITGNMRFTAKDRSDFPAVGDWVALTTYDDYFAIIHCIFPRQSVLQRPAVGQFGEIQIIATNVDYALITQAVDRDFNVNRIERYLTICYSSHVEPIILLSKTDLVNEEEVNSLLSDLNSRIKNIKIIPITNLTKDGLNSLRNILIKGKSYCLLGSSGVGKSTLVNNLIGEEILKTASISSSTNKGRHTTNYRELTILENGSILIDNPGMREVGIADSAGGLETTFDAIIQLSKDCRFPDCNHIHDKGCAVKDAVEKGIIDRESYENYMKMLREKLRFQTSIAEKRKKERSFGKVAKEIMKHRKQKKY
jgi:ribosome biogenesis GTPase / thiamine phosphate phosphatase